MKMKLKNFTPAIVLGAICLIVTALLAVINHFTAPVIADNERLARTASLREVFGGDGSGADFDLPLASLPAGTPDTVKEIYEEKNGKGYAVIIVIPKGYEGEIDLTVGVDTDGKLTGVSITKYNDSLGKDKMGDAANSLVGKGKGELGDGVLVSGATFSSKAVKAGIEDALSAVELVKSAGITAQLTSLEEGAGARAGQPENIPPLTEEEIFAKAGSMLGGASGFNLVAEKEGARKESWQPVPYRVRIYKADGDKGYAVYGETYNPYRQGAIEANYVFAVDKNFRIVDFDLLSWSLSADYQYGNEEKGIEAVHIYLESPAVKRLEESFVGADMMSFRTRVDLVTRATETSVRIEDGVLAALEFIDTEYGKEIKIYRAVGLSVFVLGIAAIGVAIYFERRRRV